MALDKSGATHVPAIRQSPTAMRLLAGKVKNVSGQIRGAKPGSDGDPQWGWRDFSDIQGRWPKSF